MVLVVAFHPHIRMEITFRFSAKSVKPDSDCLRSAGLFVGIYLTIQNPLKFILPPDGYRDVYCLLFIVG